METIKYVVKILIGMSNRINLIPVIVDFTVLYIFFEHFGDKVYGKISSRLPLKI